MTDIALPVSVIVPLYNGADHIEACLSSIECQTCPVSEVIVIDDGSQDDGPTRAQNHPLAPRVIRQPNQGPAAARNTGIRAAQHDFVAFIDQDDLWHKQKQEWQIAAFASRPALQLCYGRVDLFWDDPDSDEARAFQDHPRARQVEGFISPTLLARKSVFDSVGFLDESLRFGDGSAWAAKARDMGIDIRLLDDVVLYHRMHSKNLTRKRDESSREFLSILRQRLRQRDANGPTS